MISRRGILNLGMLAVPLAGSRGAFAEARAGDIGKQLGSLEKQYGGRLGVCVLDATTGKRVGHRADERFPMCSTFKVLAAARVLTRVDRQLESLDRRIVYDKETLVPYSPETSKHAGGDGMTVGAICEAALTLSDNTAGNLMLASFGGPPQLTRFARSLGDRMTRLDRTETSLNEATPGDPRDTTTPAAMAGNLRKIVLGTVLTPGSRERLTTWMEANKTGDKRIRAGVPKTWRIGDKTGSGDHAVANDVAVMWPPERGPIILTVYYADSSASADARSEVIASVGRAIQDM